MPTGSTRDSKKNQELSNQFFRHSDLLLSLACRCSGAAFRRIFRNPSESEKLGHRRSGPCIISDKVGSLVAPIAV